MRARALRVHGTLVVARRAAEILTRRVAEVFAIQQGRDRVVELVSPTASVTRGHIAAASLRLRGRSSSHGFHASHARSSRRLIRIAGGPRARW